MSSDSSSRGEQQKWDKEIVRHCEMDSGSSDPFPEFAEEVRAAMEHVGNEVERPLYMKVTIEAADKPPEREVDDAE